MRMWIIGTEVSMPRWSVAGLVIVLAAGCGKGSNTTGGEEMAVTPTVGAEQSPAQAPVHSPPLELEFAFQQPVHIHVVDGDVVWGLTGGRSHEIVPFLAEAWSVTTGEPVGGVSLSANGSGTHRGIFTEIDGGVAAVVAEGATSERSTTRVAAYLLHTGPGDREPIWSVQAPFDARLPRPAAASPDYLMMMYLVDRVLTTEVRLTATGEVLHEWTGFLPVAVEGELLIGWQLLDNQQEHLLQGRDATTGQVQWELPPEELRSDGTQQLVALGGGYLFYAGWVIDAATGELVMRVDGSSYCRYDGVAIVVCGQSDEEGQPAGDFVAAWDLHSADKLWTLADLPVRPEVLPGFGAVHQGVVYMMADPGEPSLVLDARTGEQLAQMPEVMHEVGAGFGIHYRVSGDPPLDWRSLRPVGYHVIHVFRTPEEGQQ